MKIFLSLFLVIICLSVKSQQYYFPPATGTTWDTISPASLNWCQDKLDTLIDYLGQHNTKAFIILKDGKIVVEHYYGTFTVDSLWYWASAGKSLTSFLFGLAQEQGYLNIQDSLPKYLGHGFSSCSSSAEDSIRIIHQLTMTCGFDDFYGGVTSENHCTDDSCLVCIAPPGTRWAYHNAPYSMTHWVLDSATQVSVNSFKNTNLLATCGITGLFIQSGYDDVYYSKARSFARFGLLMLARGIWDGDSILHDSIYYNQMINSSQLINPAYGYLWWLNGKSSYRFPNSQLTIPGFLEPNAPADMYSALGKNDQILNIVPSMNLVMIRMGDPLGLTYEVANLANDSIWEKFNEVLCSPTGMHEVDDSKPKFFPNPANTNFTVAFPGKQFDYSIFDLTGRELFYENNIYDQATINISDFPRGVFILRMKSDVLTYFQKVVLN